MGFAGQIQDPETLRLLANLVRKNEGQLPVLFAAVQLSGKPAQVAAYLMNFSQTGAQRFGRQPPLRGGRSERAVAAQPALA